MSVAVSVVVPVYNAEDTLERCLLALSNQSYRDFELIIVDNGSTDDSLTIIEAWLKKFPVDIQLIHEARQGAAAARNSGVAVSKGKWVAFTDSDCEPDKSWLETGRKIIREKTPHAMAGPAWGTMEGDLSAQLLSLTTLSVGSANHWRREVGDTGVNGFASANLWLNKKVFEQVQGFDVSLAVSGEDYDLCARLYQAGHAIYYHSQLNVRHIHSSGFIPLLAKASDYGQAHGFLFEKYGRQGLYIDMLGGIRVRLSIPYKVWVNAVSAEKKMLILLLLGLIYPIFFGFALLYPFFISRFLCQRAHDLNHNISIINAYKLGWLLVLRSFAFTLGRAKGSRRGVWLL